jgi:long-chain fatty acid transport protein
MKNNFIILCMLIVSGTLFSQSGHIMQGVGAVNMSMGGAATGQSIDFNGAILWNPAGISKYNGSEISLSVGAFFASPTLKSSLPNNMLFPGSPSVSGVTEDDKGTSILPAVSYLWGKEDSKHTFALSAFGISGFGVKFPQETNLPMDNLGSPNPNWNPNDSNPINYPQNMRGFGLVESNYMLLQISFTYAYQLSKKVSLGVQPNFDYEALKLTPNPTSAPYPAKGYPVTDNTSAIGYGAQFGIYYDSGSLLKLGASYKTKQFFSAYDFKQNYLDGSEAPNNKLTMNYPAIWSLGMGLSGKKLDFAFDFRYVDYKNTEGFAETGWVIDDNASNPSYGFPTGAVKGFGWDSMTIISTGLQYKIKENFPIRIGYTHNSLPIKDELAFYSVSATAVVQDAAQIGFGYKINDKFKIDLVYHKGFRGKGVKGTLLNPTPQPFGGPWDANTNPLGVMPGTSVSYDMDTSMIQFSLNYKLK